MNRHLRRAMDESSRNWKSENEDYARTLHRQDRKHYHGNSIASQVKERVETYAESKGKPIHLWVY